ncbi:MAG: hypothetical protein IT187_07510 [Geothrix sp.]|nr:hypothetical protein [Geothrix sp.]
MTVNLGSRRQGWETQQDLQRWIEGEIAVWSWLDGPSNSDGNLARALDEGQKTLQNSVLRMVHQFSQNPGLHGNMRSLLESQFSTGRILLSTSPEAKFILSLRDQDPIAAAWAVAFLTRGTLNLNSASGSAMDGIISAWAYRNGLKKTATAEKAALEAVFKESQTALAALKESSLSAKNEADGLAEAFRQAQEAFQEKHSDTIQAAADALMKRFSEAEERLKSVETTYDSKMALQAPVTYWTSKKHKHFKNIWKVGSAVVLLTGFGGWGIVAFVRELLPKLEKPEPWKLGLVLVSLTMLIWFVRVLMKVVLSQVHLFTDAEEREVLATTYLSLLRSNEALKDEDRTLILQILFRPVATGIVDDGGPATPTELVGRVIGGGK